MSERREFGRGETEEERKKKGMEIGIADWQTKLKFNCIRTGARSEGGRRKRKRKKKKEDKVLWSCVKETRARKETKKEGRSVGG